MSFKTYIIVLLFSLSSFFNSAYAITPDTIPAGAKQLTPEEFQELKKYESKQKQEKNDFAAPVVNAGLSSGGGKEGAIIVFAIVGAVIIVAWIPYIVFTSYKAFKHPDQFEFNYLLSSQFANIHHSDDLDQNRNGVMSSIRFAPYMASLKKDEDGNSKSDNLKFGFNFELGYYDFSDEVKVTGVSQNYHSPYWLLGPSISYGNFNGKNGFPLFLKLDLTAGTSFHQDVDLISKAEITLNYSYVKFFVGLGVGGLYLYGREGKGLVNHLSDLSTQFIGNFGYIF